jgi:hypothetical protein
MATVLGSKKEEADGKRMATVLGSKRKEEKGTGTYSTASFPLGFKFGPTDEQLIDHYLRLKNEGRGSEVPIIGEVDFYKYEPWDLPGTFFSLNKLIFFLLIWLGIKHACVMFLLNLDLSVIKSDERDWFFFCRRDAVPDPQQFNPDADLDPQQFNPDGKDGIPTKKSTRPKLWPTHEPLTLRLRKDGIPPFALRLGITGDSDSEITDIDSKIDSNPDSKIDGGCYPPDAKQLAWTTTAGYWKSTGNRSIQLSAYRLLGMKKTLAFYEGRAPNGWPTNWMMHEYSATEGDLVGTSPHQARFFFLLSHNAFSF